MDSCRQRAQRNVIGGWRHCPCARRNRRSKPRRNRRMVQSKSEPKEYTIRVVDPEAKGMNWPPAGDVNP